MNTRRLKDVLASKLVPAAAVFSSVIVFIIAIALYLKSKSLLEIKSLGDLFLSTTWLPSQGDFGFFQFILGTLYVTILALVIAIPLSLLSAIYLAEYAHENFRSKVLPLVDLLAGIPSVVYGVFGILAIVPAIAYITPLVGKLGIPFLTMGSYSTGFSLLAGSMVLAIMVFPVIISISHEVIRAVPFEVREASLSLGATQWQTIKHAVLRSALPGLAAAIILGFSRAFGETMAVLMVAGTVLNHIPESLFDPVYPLPALIALNYGEMMSIPMYDSALLLASLILMFVILLFTLAARLILMRIERRMAHG